MPTSVGSRDTAAHSFRAEIYTVGINRCVDVPPEVSEALGGQTHIQVKGTVCRKVFSSNLAPRGDGAHRLFIHSKIWRRLGVDIGDALAAFQALTVPNRKRFVDRIEETKSPETRARRVDQGVQLLVDRPHKQRGQ